jgi:hypothetical protein
MPKTTRMLEAVETQERSTWNVNSSRDGGKSSRDGGNSRVPLATAGTPGTSTTSKINSSSRDDSNSRGLESS